MSELTDIREGLAANLDALGIQVSPYMLANPTPPCAHLYPGGGAGEIAYHRAMADGVELWPFTVQVFVPLSSDIGSQVKLDAFVASTGSQSVKAALESDKTLGGAAQTLNVVSCSGHRIYALERGGAVLGAEWHVEVYPTGT